MYINENLAWSNLWLLDSINSKVIFLWKAENKKHCLVIELKFRKGRLGWAFLLDKFFMWIFKEENEH